MCDAPILAVPHRAKGALEEGVPNKMPWELKENPFGPVLGDQRTREELNARGNPAEFLDVGVVVQPMYYYMGHISRHVSLKVTCTICLSTLQIDQLLLFISFEIGATRVESRTSYRRFRDCGTSI